MTFTVTPQPDNVPPRVRIDTGTGNSAMPFASLTILRDGKPIREQPFVGSSVAVAFDYEAPFGVPTTYSAQGTYIPVGVPVWTESWASVGAWTGSGWSVSAGTAQASVEGSAITRTTGGTIQKLSVGGAVVQHFALELLDAAGSLVVRLRWATGFGLMSLESDTGATKSAGLAGGAANLTLANGLVTARAADGSWTLATGYTGVPTKVRLVAGSSPARVGSISATLAQAPANFTATATATMNITETWLIHPSKPSLSIPIYSHGGQAGVRWIEASSGESKSSQAVSTVHRPVGRRRAVVITSGPRQADEWTLVVESMTIAAKNALRAIVDDQTPLLMRSPASAGMDLPDDWYSVGDVTVTRVEVPVITEASLMTLPLTPVDEPVVRVGALWTWGDVVTTYSTWQQVLDANATWLDVLAGPQS